MKQSNIDQLFRKARETEPMLQDDGFADRITARVRQHRQPELMEPNSLSVVYTVLFSLLGGITFYWIFPIESWISEALISLNSILSLLPVISGLMMLFLVVALILDVDQL